MQKKENTAHSRNGFCPAISSQYARELLLDMSRKPLQIYLKLRGLLGSSSIEDLLGLDQVLQGDPTPTWCLLSPVTLVWWPVPLDTTRQM